MYYPAEQEPPENGCKNEVQEGRQQPPLNELPQTRDEEATQGSDDVSSRALT